MNLSEPVAREMYVALKACVAAINPYSGDGSDFAAHAMGIAALNHAEADPPVTDAFAKQQVGRLAGMYRFPDNKPGAVRELVRALMTAQSQEIVTEVIDTILGNATEETPCPMSSTLEKEILRVTRERQGEYLPDPTCGVCSGEGYLYAAENSGYTGVSQCSCWSRRGK
jgi:hypothetical protein